MNRDRDIYHMHATMVEPGFLYLDLITQAGTHASSLDNILILLSYVKEFVHGDFGRTNPNLSSLLGTESLCDLLLLDGRSIIKDTFSQTFSGSSRLSLAAKNE